MLGTVDAGNQRMKVQLITAQIEVAPNAFAMIVFGALATARWATTRAAPLKSDIDAAVLEIELGFGDIPGVSNAQQATQQFGIAHSTSLRRPPRFLYLAHSNSRRAIFVTGLAVLPAIVVRQPRGHGNVRGRGVCFSSNSRRDT